METTFINASRSIQEDTWYNVSAKMTEDHVTSELHDVNGTLLASTTAEKNGTRTSETGILITYDVNTIIVFRGLKAATLVQEASIDSDGDLAGRREIGLVAPQGELTTALIAGVIAVFVHGKMRKKKKLSIQK